ncbi:MAG: hypothetical protein ACI85O_002235 [Saprospiraceae bacterium]|jgi:hypothetical protein
MFNLVIFLYFNFFSFDNARKDLLPLHLISYNNFLHLHKVKLHFMRNLGLIMKILHIAFILFLFSLNLIAQQNVEAGFFAGVANYQGDLAEDEIEIGETKLAYGGYISYLLNPKVIIRGNVYYGNISGEDTNSTELALRGFSFNADVLEIGVNAQWLIFGRSRYNNSGIFVPQFTPYLSGGVAITTINADLTYPDTDENNLNFPEKADTDNFLVVPISAGLRYELVEFLTLGFELGARATFSDHVDNVSLNGNPNKNDWYLFGGFTLGYVFGSADNFNF